MPVDFVPGFNETRIETDDSSPSRDRAVQREGVSVAMRTAAVWTALFEAVLIAGLFLMRPTLIAAEAEIHAGEHWDSALMPTVLLGFFGVGFGLAVGWRITSQAGLTGRPTWLIGAVAALTLALTGAVVGLVIFEGTVPGLFALSLTILWVGAAGGLAYFAYWSE